jgi:hypothetical protein
LRTLEKRPEDRPANASEFRNELFEIAERLGLEHAAITEVPDLEALRGVGVQSPSGRLVIDIAKLRENRALNSAVSEVTLVNPRPRVSPSPKETPPHARQSFPRVDVPLRRRSIGRFLPLAGMIVAALFLGGYIALRMRAPERAPVVTAPTPAPTAIPTVTSTVTPSPSPSVTPTPKASPTPEKKKRGKIGSFVNRVKGILKKPFK